MSDLATEPIYLHDSYLKETDAKVLFTENEKVILDKTIFYPEGGGQPTDVGKITHMNIEYSVKEVKKHEGTILHHLDRMPNFKNGDIRI
ncbi:MAG: alanine--tRNA ligase-related protein [Thermoplasmata archaeon]